MNLHNNPDVFLELINRTAEYFKIPEVYVEKDYWVTHVLLQLSLSEFRNDFIFKGGTALSKVFGLIKRFSEDVDLAMFNNRGLSSNQIKKCMKAAEETIATGLTYIQKPDESKGSQFRKVYYKFPRIVSGEFGHASDVILLETNSFTSPEPFSFMPTESLIAEFIKKAQIEGGNEIITHYGLEKFEVNVLDIKRTVAEKILGLVRASSEADPKQALADKIRHIYDLCMIKRNKHYSQFFDSDSLWKMMDIVIQADRDQFREAGQWLDQPLHKSVLFSKSSEIWESIRGIFHGEFSELVYDSDLPSDDEVFSLLSSVASLLQKWSD
ncbi:nucleotidyl transferase AbiEii/AbiGii toxin family protein [Proteus mirabilis]|uniref:nucleotidyl transferase AbiEii/AbiGii toxin family protein n=2 Tax=Proteus mirabilis TaxID=584 RepID=UPI00117BCBC5|nr:nucleotidyl transferase AbiEii/AbiGii toxin family protein [Proteus mirabilis]EKU6440764.1 nucleotidyl transferase AbiEii/AbiGii toxin family protein [Proteus mirabilis]EKU6778517.1 nucleotidyl transferase AbiEii/AbiGii toxin family protein [Proteus mirabilis]EKU7262589.1 nucleotidyl transferase AbiEii/AbiGii toxin family protein [Proteus mirabilis]EKV5077518.1 nucleotidyl transferase AbiEii/AbiGii toxin family protein [Proteus mirabilis]EKX6521930.1 nucleotidyl transferase AbiEii/AbiGii to